MVAWLKDEIFSLGEGGLCGWHRCVNMVRRYGATGYRHNKYCLKRLPIYELLTEVPNHHVGQKIPLDALYNATKTNFKLWGSRGSLVNNIQFYECRH